MIMVIICNVIVFLRSAIRREYVIVVITSNIVIAIIDSRCRNVDDFSISRLIDVKTFHSLDSLNTNIIINIFQINKYE